MIAVLLVLAVGCSDFSDGQVATGSADASDEVWHPEPGLSWQWQLSDLPVDTSVEADMYDIDLFENTESVVDELHDMGRRVVCYVSVGTWEPGRPDSGEFPDEVIGKPLDDFPDERWLDIRRLDVLGPIIEARFEQCAEKGFDAVEPDNVDGYQNDSGFDLSAEDQLAFNRFVAGTAHERGLAVGLKNDLDQVPDLVDEFDFAVNEECVEFDECMLLTPFIDADKAVFHVEYELEPDEFCDLTADLDFSSLKKNVELDAEVGTCG
ncbi:MAG: endo alpha-1,4 polygalactosaminidase [Actinobacteria bacterium]|nr:MAG: endo alpha-1,4 polygalactosaminidase [Actinomycetota bacterium]RIK04636.1 MAG: endo alpha-1,4 polygalactosaminidase [Acidobacteriota bacterium]